MSIPSRRATLAAGAALLAAALAVPAGAAVKNNIMNSTYNTNPLSFNSGYNHYVDWSQTTIAGHNTYATMDKFGSQAKYLDYTTYAFQGSPTRCFHLATRPVSGVNADTEISVKNNNGIWVKLSDDPPLYTPYAHAYFWIVPGGNTRNNPKIRVNGYSSARNQDAFQLESTFFTQASQSACLDGVAGIPGSIQQASAIIDGNGNVIINRVL